ncbi:MAG: sugar phosphorylase [Anaerolineae bacterium]|nr:sugar phosphorylase [Anaerolineae bacterium]
MNADTERIRALLRQLYSAEQAESTYTQIIDLAAQTHPAPRYPSPYFSERTVTLITYGDTLQHPGEAPLHTLRRFMDKRLKGVIDTVHILPFYPYSSDDGFSVIDYYAIDPNLGSWEDVTALSADYRLMFDAVINHMSVQSPWFQKFLAGDPAFQGMVLTESPDTDLSSVTRPRTTPLLTPFVKHDGQTAHVWTTFSDDQVDLDYRDPQTLLRVLAVLLFYVEQGAQVIRLDAIAYLWKQAGTSCIHLPQTHAVVQLIRAVLDVVAPQVIVITETNVPHAENISYFGDGTNEAQLVYNFTLPPLLLHTLIAGNATKLTDWINSLPRPTEHTAFFNFTASHDGIGVRPVEGILNTAEIQQLIAAVEQRGGRVSYKANPDGSSSPYELNITYVDAVASPDQPESMRIASFILSQAVMLTLAGVPAVYIHSLLGSHNNIAGMQITGQNRTINRAKLDEADIEAELDDPTSFRAQVLSAYTHLLRVRTAYIAFHPQGEQQATSFNHGRILAIQRTAPDQSERVLVLFNVTGEPQTVQLTIQPQQDILTNETIPDQTVQLAPYQVRWLRL